MIEGTAEEVAEETATEETDETVEEANADTAEDAVTTEETVVEILCDTPMQGKHPEFHILRQGILSDTESYRKEHCVLLLRNF